jgi:predicted RND superfamily exporter protein
LVSRDLGEVLEEDFVLAAWLVAAAILVLVAVAFRQPGRALLSLAPVALGILFMLGTLGLAGTEISLMTLMALPIVLGLGVDFGVYFTARLAATGGDAAEALKSVGPAIVVAGLTTLAGFAALLSADLEGLRTLGLAVVLGAGYSLAASVFILPILRLESPPSSFSGVEA